eukprot:CAMPEP_0114600236 /NCGR_PEP_ID=MMETSP0125-20121206/22800_1 /TAXON_ID=485358 ORGANISM="Aristerostoma sp., Strain ATCC 50986" /NCGR_SAMPLE_ID=MMETSP0125 /ASSEMBLY_ACC=CAM_ASM_000245 /LENGTH=97 /DNA_ID=CAMNT_0001808153 /DNA_START=128 /DNA_END=421 /DNA_ORIENTATION=-
MALVFANVGAAYGTYRAGVGIGSIGVTKPELIMKSIIPIVMAGVSVILIQKVNTRGDYTLYNGYAHLCAGLCCGLSSLTAGYAIGVVGNAGVKANAL